MKIHWHCGDPHPHKSRNTTFIYIKSLFMAFHGGAFQCHISNFGKFLTARGAPPRAAPAARRRPPPPPPRSPRLGRWSMPSKSMGVQPVQPVQPAKSDGLRNKQGKLTSNEKKWEIYKQTWWLRQPKPSRNQHVIQILSLDQTMSEQVLENMELTAWLYTKKRFTRQPQYLGSKPPSCFWDT